MLAFIVWVLLFKVGSPLPPSQYNKIPDWLAWGRSNYGNKWPEKQSRKYNNGEEEEEE
jgi:hypothetical protein